MRQHWSALRGSLRAAALGLTLVAFGAVHAHAQQKEKLSVVASLTVYRDIAREIVGERGEVAGIAEPRQDAHFVQAKPSYSIMLSRADLLIDTGLDLEMWMPAVIDKSRNPNIREGQVGYVSVSTGVPMLEVPDNPSRAGGDIHIFGNPHIHTDPLRAVIIANNIKIGLQKVDPQSASYYDERFRDFKGRIHERLFGSELVGLVGGDKLAELEMTHQLLPFLESNQMGGQSLATRLGGWMKEAECLRGKQIVAYHLNWIYLADRFGIEIVAYVERRPGIPPSASHVADLIELIRRDKIQALWVADYFDEKIPTLLAERTGAKFLYVPLYTGSTPGTADYFGLVDGWIQAMRSGFPECQ
jgi:ABC-type Zn uptake system ZnuABC Zn-binding protein ZnuA